MKRFDAIVIGGGLIGLGIAWRAAARGLEVMVVDDGRPEAASEAAAGMLAPITEVHYGEEALLRLNLESAQRYPSFIAELEQLTGLPTGYRATGTLTVAFDADDNAALEDLYRFQRRMGLRVQRLRGSECRRLEPSLAPGVRGGVLAEDDHQVDNRLLLRALRTALDRVGAHIRRQRAAGVAVEAGRVTGVELDDGETLTASQVVVAAGCWSSDLLPAGAPGEMVRPVKGQILRLHNPAGTPYLERTVRGLVRGSGVYLVPRADGEVVVGATSEEQGWDARVTVEGVYTLLRDAYFLLPGIIDLTLTETRAGLRPGSPDNAPLLGATAVDGLILAAGHYRNGVLLTPVTADAIAELLATGNTSDIIAPFSPRRLQGSTLVSA